MSQQWKLGKLTRERSDGSRYWSYCIIWPNPKGGRHRASLGTTCPVTADTKAKRVWEQMQLAKADSLGRIVDLYLEAIGDTLDGPRKRQRWGKMRPFWGHLTLADIDKDTSLKHYPEWRKVATNTIRNELSLIKAACKWALEDKKLITQLPIIKLPPQPRSRVTHLTKAEFRKFMDKCCFPHIRLFAMLAIATGGRKSAICEAKWEQVSWNMGQIDLQGEREEVGNKGRATVPLSDRIMLALREAKDGALTEYIIEYAGERVADPKKGIRLTGQRAGLKVHAHMFRHSAAVWMAEDRVPMSEIAAFLGHKDSRITERVYAKYHPDYLRQASKSLDW